MTYQRESLRLPARLSGERALSDGESRQSHRTRSHPVFKLEPILVDRATAAAALALSVSTSERQVALGRVPKPRRVSRGRVGWLWRELVEAAQAVPVSDPLPSENTCAPKPRPPRR
jgi:prophage regulatory protein